MSRSRPGLVLVLVAIAMVAVPAQATLFGLRNPGDGGRQLVSIDPPTGAITPISASISPPLPSAQGVNALDFDGNRFFFVAFANGEADSRIFTVDTVTGALLGDPVIAGSATAPIMALEWDAAEGVLYALRNPGDAGRQIATLDPVTGAITGIGPSIDPPLATPSGVTALDADANRFYFIGLLTGETDFRIYTVDTATGAALSNPVIPGSGTAFLLHLAWDNGEGTLYALRNPGDGGRQLATVDPATGTITGIGASISPPLPSGSGNGALDEEGNRFFFHAFPNTSSFDGNLYTVDTATGAVLTSPVLAGSSTAFFLGFEWGAPSVPPVANVTIDVHPQKINLKAKGVIPVTVFTTPSFDAATIDVGTVQFGPGNAAEAHGALHLTDVDGDGDLDAVLHFRTQDAAIPCGATSVTLSGAGFTGSDAIVTICP